MTMRLIAHEAGAVHLLWADEGTIIGGVSRFMRPGSGPPSVTEIKTRLRRPAMIINLSVRSRTGPGLGRTDLVIVRRNGVDTTLAVNLTGAETFKEVRNPQAFAVDDDLSIKLVTNVATGTTNLVVLTMIDYYNGVYGWMQS